MRNEKNLRKIGAKRKRNITYLILSFLVLLSLLPFVIKININEQISGIDYLVFFSILSIPIIHITIYLMQKYRILKDESNPHLVVWLGLIGIFVGFTLSTYASDILSTLNTKNKVIARLEMAIATNVQRRYYLSSDMIQVIEYYKLEDRPKPRYYAYPPQDDGVKLLAQDGELLTRISSILRFEAIGWDNFIPKSIKYPAKNDFDNLKALDYYLLDAQYKESVLELELALVKGEINNKDYYKLRNIISYKYSVRTDEIVSKDELNDYVQDPRFQKSENGYWLDYKGDFSFVPVKYQWKNLATSNSYREGIAPKDFK